MLAVPACGSDDDEPSGAGAPAEGTVGTGTTDLEIEGVRIVLRDLDDADDDAGGSDDDGFAELSASGESTRIVAEVDADDDDAAGRLPMHVHPGSCDALDPEPAFTLEDARPVGGDVDASDDDNGGDDDSGSEDDSGGDDDNGGDDRGGDDRARSDTSVAVPLAELLSGGYSIDAHAPGDASGSPVACGEIDDGGGGDDPVRTDDDDDQNGDDDDDDGGGDDGGGDDDDGSGSG